MGDVAEWLRSGLQSRGHQFESDRGLHSRIFILEEKNIIYNYKNKNMKAYQIVENGKPLEEREIEKPVPSGKEILLKTVACGVCHSDVHIHEGFFSLGDDAKLPVPLMTDALAMGHEIFGEVVELGDEVEGVEIGKKYVAYPWIGCGECRDCLHDREH